MTEPRFTPSQHRQARETQVDELGQPLTYYKYEVGARLKLLRNFEHNGNKFQKDSIVTICSFPPMMYKNDVATFHRTRYIAAKDADGHLVTIVNFNEVRRVK